MCCPPWEKGGERATYGDCRLSDAHGEDRGMDLLGRAWLAKRRAMRESTMGFEVGIPTDVWLTQINRNEKHRRQYVKENPPITDQQWKKRYENKRQLKLLTGGGHRDDFWRNFI